MKEHIRIQPSAGLRSLDLGELWRYRELLWVLTLRDIKIRYKQTVLGVVWAVLQPVLTMAIFTLVFGRMAKMPSDGYPYPIFSYAALLPWIFFSNSVSSAGNSLVSSANMVSKIYFPRLLIPMSSVGAGFFDFLISSSILLLMMVFYGVGWSWQLLMAPLLTLMLIFTALGIGTWLSALNVTYRDFRYVIPFFVQIWMFVTPVVYPASMVPEAWRWALFLNPMTGIIEGFRSTFLGSPFDWSAILLSLAVSVVIFVVGIVYFEKTEHRFADII